MIRITRFREKPRDSAGISGSGVSFTSMNTTRQAEARKKAVVLLSGGLDSAVTLYWALNKGFAPHCISFDYGQRHKRELRSAELIAERAGAVRRLVRIELPWKGSALLDKRVALPEYGKSGPEIPATYVPARNIIFLAFAASLAEAIGARTIGIGVNQVDFSGYPDCRAGFLRAFENALNRGTKQGAQGGKISLAAPLLHKSKAQIIKLGARLGVPFGLTWSCYKGGRRPCGACDSCFLRRRGFAAAKIKDPLG